MVDKINKTTWSLCDKMQSMDTVKTLILFRHAKSHWDADYHTDHERPLANRGVKAAKKMGRLIADSNQLPDIIISSTALRAKQTIEIASETAPWNTPIQFADELYNTTTNSVVDLLKQLPEHVNTVMLVGHEPTWSKLTSILTGGGNIRFPTAAMACIGFHVSHWKDVGPASGQLRWLLIPRLF